jgi:branched-chain amino acid transport system permease protein
MKVLFVGSAVSALAGALYAFYSSMVQYTVYNRTTYTFWPYLMLILGGAGNNEGAIIGCVIFVIARRLINYYKNVFAAFLPFDPDWLDYMMLGIILLIMLTRRPQGMFPEKSTETLPRSKLEQIRQSLKKKIEER